MPRNRTQHHATTDGEEDTLRLYPQFHQTFRRIRTGIVNACILLTIVGFCDADTNAALLVSTVCSNGRVWLWRQQSAVAQMMTSSAIESSAKKSWFWSTRHYKDHKEFIACESQNTLYIVCIPDETSNGAPSIHISSTSIKRVYSVHI
jgi:hypothetical protein